MSQSNFDPSVIPGLEEPVVFTAAELLEEANEMRAQVRSGEVDPVAAASRLAVISVTLRPDIVDEISGDESLGSVVPLELAPDDETLDPADVEDITSAAARLVVGKVLSVGSTESVSERGLAAVLSATTKTPVIDAARGAKEFADAAEKRGDIETAKKKIKGVEEKEGYRTTSKARGEFTYTPDNSGKPKDGKYLQRAIGNLRADDGSEEREFSSNEAIIVTALTINDPAVELVRADLATLDELAGTLRGLQAPQHRGLLSAVTRLSDMLAEGALVGKEVGPLLDWADRFFAVEGPQDDEDVEDNTTLSLGPFHNARVLEGEFFPPGLVEIDPEMFTDKSLIADSNFSLSELRGSYQTNDQRMVNFVELKERVEDDIVDTDLAMQLLRSQNSRWHPMPWWGIRVYSPTDPSVDRAIFETVVKKNRTYGLLTPQWKKQIRMTRGDARKEPGVHPIRHNHESAGDLSGHAEEMYTTFTKGLVS